MRVSFPNMFWYHSRFTGKRCSEQVLQLFPQPCEDSNRTRIWTVFSQVENNLESARMTTTCSMMLTRCARLHNFIIHNDWQCEGISHSIWCCRKSEHDLSTKLIAISKPTWSLVSLWHDCIITSKRIMAIIVLLATKWCVCNEVRVNLRSMNIVFI
jgi:hypothetical protein